MYKQFIFSFIEHYRNIGMFLGLTTEFFGMPFPGGTLISILGYSLLRRPDPSVGLTILFALGGSNFGSLLAYFIGARYGEAVVLRIGRHIHLTKAKLDSIKENFDKDKVPFLLFSRFIPGVMHAVPYLSGMSKVNFRKFMVYNFIGSVIWCASYFSIGYFMGENWRVVERIAKAYLLEILLLGLFVFAVIKYFNKYKKAVFLTAFPLFLFIKLAEDYVSRELTIFDETIYDYLKGFISKDLTLFMRAISNLGSPQVLFFISIVCFLVLRRHKFFRAYGSIIIINLIASSTLNELFKLVFHRQRPDILHLVKAAGYSFPSGHSMVSISFYGLLLYLYIINADKKPKKYIIITFLCSLIFLIGISRIYLGVHYASDVLAGFAAGLAWLTAFISIAKRYLRLKKI